MSRLSFRASRPDFLMPLFCLTEELIFPDPNLASDEGLLAIGGDLSPERLLLAYLIGVFPWYGQGEPILWWSPDPRCVLFPAEVYVSRRLERTLKQKRFTVTCNRAFDRVVCACAEVRNESGEETWLVPEMQAAYRRLHALGLAHSVEAWREGELVGGLYGVAFGRFFFGESMFHYATDASKVCLVSLARTLAAMDFLLFDCQVPNPHLLRMGARTIPRQEFLERLRDGGATLDSPVKRVVLPEVLSDER